MLNNVLPRLAVPHGPDGAVVNAELTSHLAHSDFGIRANQAHIFFGQSRPRVALSKRGLARASVFRNTVDRVVLNASDEQVFRIDARRDVTCVADEHSARNNAAMNHERDAVCSCVATFNFHSSVSTRIDASPKPAAVRLFKRLPEPRNGIFIQTQHSSLLCSVLSGAGVRVAAGIGAAILLGGFQ